MRLTCTPSSPSMASCKRRAQPQLSSGPHFCKEGTIDPSRAVIGAWQPHKHHGFALEGEPGSPTSFELHTRDYDRVVPFYRTAFRWNTN